MSAKDAPDAGIAMSGAGSTPALGKDGQLKQSNANDGLGHRVPAPAGGDKPEFAMPGGISGQAKPSAPGSGPEFASPGGAEGV